MSNGITFFSQYCERTHDGLWAEPINAMSNVAFIIAGFFCLKMYYSEKSQTTSHRSDILALIFLLFSIGIGSFLWHTIALPWSELADVLPILCFIGLYVISFLRRVSRLSILSTTLVFIVFQIINNGIILYTPKHILNGSLFYIATFIMLLIFTVYLYQIRHPSKGLLSGAILYFCVALFFRTIDSYICNIFPIGTHFLWHVFIAIVLLLSTSLLIKQAFHDN